MMVMVTFLNYLPEKQKMEIKEFKFFHGITLHSDGIQNIIRMLRDRRETEIDLVTILTEEFRTLVNEINEENTLNLGDITNIEI
jgi:hypothetical protein